MTVTINGSGTITGVTTMGTTVVNQTLTTPTITSTMGVGNATPAASGAGITFPATQSASTDANTLDDYEEGTWSPTLKCYGTDPTISTASLQGYYIKVGGVIHLWFIWFGNITGGGTGGVYIGGLPFNANTYRAPGVITYNGAIANSNSGFVEVGTNQFIPITNGSQATPNSWNVANTVRIFFQCTMSNN